MYSWRKEELLCAGYATSLPNRVGAIPRRRRREEPGAGRSGASQAPRGHPKGPYFICGNPKFTPR